MDAIILSLARELGREAVHVENVVKLIDEGNTIPFIARYRKELHGTMDDTTLRTLADRLNYLRNLDKRRGEVKAAIEGQGKLTEELSAAIDAAATLAEVEDLYRPYRQKRRTRATAAREKGLEPLAQLLFAQERDCPDPEKAAQAYIDPEKGVESAEQALQGAGDIIAEWISDDAGIRKALRELWWRKADLVSSAAGKEPEDSVYRLYYQFRTPVCRAMGHQVLAINRGEREELLKAAVDMDRETALIAVRRAVLVPGAPSMAFVRSAAEDAYDRLIAPSVEREIRNTLTEHADEGAIRNFGLNLKPLLMQPPVKGKVTMGLDPGYRNGCKVAVVDGTGKVLDTAVVYPTFSERKKQEAIDVLARMARKHGVEHIAIGNGTASRETEQMTVELIRSLGGGVSYMIVNEAGASVYSASKLAAEEFPDYDVNLRSAVSIARRLQDPLAELVKIDPKAIGVGQYQHDMPQARLDETLNGVVEDCVNAVGVDLNTASVPLLTRVSGLNAATAKNIVKYREENGAFTTRRQVLKVPKLGPKAFEQAAGFLRVPESKNVLDNTAVHPESYAAAEVLLELCGCDRKGVKAGAIGDLRERVAAYGEERAAAACGVGVPTLRDLVTELLKPGRDPRDELPKPILRTDVMEIRDLKPGMELTGTVRNVIDFGVFVDVGVHQDGLVHISQLCQRRVRHPSEVCAVGDVVTVWVLEVEEKKKRISLTMRKPKEG
ncbi:MAG: RNA-binding transcriptional accessory protein [Intestinimonas massiliensis]|uniref:Tex family protein n=1 Tax=Intestinimonas TaxID=1392389 RepID=UPI0024320106|nr:MULTISPECIES: Tex family protein [Intestinimonas]MCI5562822.1 RNA-binding transcriptional accessory protein [Intestinimonas massiliensis (ex Afouda et al. 2020)]MDY5338779.1 Tex family protein [Intestinimonas sp.]